MSKRAPTEEHLARLRAQVSKTKRRLRSQRNAEILAQELSAMGGKVLSPTEVGYLKNHLPPHIGEAIVRTIGTAKVQAERPARKPSKGTEKKTRQRAEKRAAGWVPLTVWVRPENIDAVKALAALEAPIEAPAPLDTPLGDFFEDYERTTLHGQIEAWFRDIQSGARPSHDLTAEAVCLHNRMDDEDRADYLQHEPIDGGFVLRLIDSWATRPPEAERVVRMEEADESTQRENDRQALRAAIRAVHMEKAGLEAPTPPQG